LFFPEIDVLPCFFFFFFFGLVALLLGSGKIRRHSSRQAWGSFQFVVALLMEGDSRVSVATPMFMVVVVVATEAVSVVLFCRPDPSAEGVHTKRYPLRPSTNCNSS
jgi:hypothetical protein